jgi:integrase
VEARGGWLLEASGLPHLKPHGARHSYGTNLLRATGDIHYVAQQLGHSSVKVTEDYYLHLTASDRRHKVGAYAAAIAAKRAHRSTTGVGPELIQDRSTPPADLTRR